MKPSRELDARVAEAMGWTWNNKTATSPTGSRNARNEGDPWWWLPHYSSRIEDAWQAWEWLNESLPYDTIALLRDPETQKPSVMATLVIEGPNTGEVFDFKQSKWVSDTYPHAICLAVLEVAKEKANEP